MTNRTALSPLACTAIAAVLAIAPTTAFAQETAAQTSAPDPVTAADPAPAAAAAAPAPIIIPEMRAAPVVQAVPEPSAAPEPAAATTAATPARAAPRQTARTVAPVAAAAPVTAQAPPAQVAQAAPVAAPAEISPVAAIDPAPQPAAAPAQDNSTALELGLLGLVALGGAGAYIFARRRRDVAQPETVYSDERYAAPAPVVTEPVSVQTPSASAWVPVVATSAAAPMMFERRPLAASTAGSAIAPGPLPTGPALAELFEQMARAAPDAENPFKGDKRRRARVRWLMKQHEYRLRDAAGQNAEDRFDFRTFAASTKQAEPARIRREVVPA